MDIENNYPIGEAHGKGSKVILQVLQGTEGQVLPGKQDVRSQEVYLPVVRKEVKEG